MYPRILLKSVSAVIISVLLTSCVVAVIATGAAVAGLVYDRRSVNTLAADARLFHLIHKDIIGNPRFRQSRIGVTSFNRVVLLVGQAPSMEVKQLARRIASSVSGVERVYDEITLSHPLSLKECSQDTWITSQVRTQMLTRKDLESGSVRIVTERRVVYLMGIVTLNQANLAVDVARRTPGVVKVVKIFKYVH